MQLLSLAHTERDKGPLFPVTAPRLQLPTAPTCLGRVLSLPKAKGAPGLAEREGKMGPGRFWLRCP